MVLRCKIEKMRVGGFQDGVGECMEGQIGGKSGPGVLRTRQSGDLGAWGEAWERAGGDQGPLLGGATWFWQRFPSPIPRAFLSNKETRKPDSHSLMTPLQAGVGGYIL